MRKFVFQHKKEIPVITEVEIEKLTPMDDPSVAWLKPGEYKARIILPTTFHMKVEKKLADGSRQITMEPDSWHSHAFYDTIEDAEAYASRIIREGYEFALRKHQQSYTEEEVSHTISKIQIVRLT